MTARRAAINYRKSLRPLPIRGAGDSLMGGDVTQDDPRDCEVGG